MAPDAGVLDASRSPRSIRRSARTKEERGELLQLYREGMKKREKPSPQLRARLFAVSGPWLSLQVAAIITDLVILSLTWSCRWDSKEFRHGSSATNCEYAQVGHRFYVISVITSVIYIIDIAIRLYAFTCSVFFSKILNWFDFIVVVVSFIGSVSPINGSPSSVSVSVFRVARLVRVLRLTTTMRACCGCMRRVTGENKKRFVSAEHDFDLDVVYITPWLIAMSVPAAGCMTSLYRNPLSEVVRFFERFHGGKYFIANLCPELPYPAARFRTGHVEWFDVQDHTPPLLADTVSFLRKAQEWLEKDEENVIAVHCRGGKGRTGSFCCALLLHTMEAEDAEDALTYFCLMRTDTDQKGKAKTQGVETPSQMRYVEYIGQLLRDQRAYAPRSMKLPTPKLVSLQRFELHGCWLEPLPADLVVAVHDMASRRIVHWAEGKDGQWQLGDVSVCNDVRISIFGRGKDAQDANVLELRRSEADRAHAAGKRVLAGKEPGCLIYFIFHTFFLPDDGRLEVPMTMIDNASKKKDGKPAYDMSGKVSLSFTLQ